MYCKILLINLWLFEFEKDAHVSHFPEISNSSFTIIPGTAAQTKFRNLRKRYTKAKKNHQAVNRSGTSAKAVEKARKKLEAFNYLRWLDDYIQQRSTKTNIDDSDEEDEADEEEDDDNVIEIDRNHDGAEMDVGLDNEEDDDGDSSVGASAGEEVSVAEEVDLLQGSVAENFVASRKQKENKNTKSTAAKPPPRLVKSKKVKIWEKSRDIEKEEISVMRALAKNLGKDEGTGVSGKRERDTLDIYGELVASKLREMSRDAQEQAQLAIDTILINHRIRDRRRPLAPLDAFPNFTPPPSVPVHRQRFRMPQYDLLPMQQFDAVPMQLYRPSSIPPPESTPVTTPVTAPPQSPSPLSYATQTSLGL